MGNVTRFMDQFKQDTIAQVVEPNGWHLAHKAALEFFGYGTRAERFPHAEMSEKSYEECKIYFKKIIKR